MATVFEAFQWGLSAATRNLPLLWGAGDAGVRERGVSHAAAGGVFLFVSEAAVCEPMVVADFAPGRSGDGLRTLSFWQDGVRPWHLTALTPCGAGCVWCAEPGVSGSGAGGAASELLETGNSDGSAALPGAGVWSAGGDVSICRE